MLTVVFLFASSVLLVVCAGGIQVGRQDLGGWNHHDKRVWRFH